MAQALAGRNCRVIESTSDEAPGLLASVAHHLGAPHSPDLCHVQHEWSKAGAVPMAAKLRAAAKVLVQAEEALRQVQARLQTTTGAREKCGPGRPAQAATKLAQVEQDVDAACQAHHRLAGQREPVTQRIRAIGPAYHFVDLERGGRRNGKRIAGDLHAQSDTIRSLAQQAGRSHAC
jgi:hypothetical protein